MSTNIDQKLDAILAAVKSLDARVSRIENGSAGIDDGPNPTFQAATKKLSIKEFLLQQNFSTDIQRTLAIGYFLETHAGMTSFTKAEIEKGYSDAKEPVPSNTGVNIAHCIKHGHLMEADEKKNNKTAYTVTRSGEQFVLAGYQKSASGK
ncbi:MAG: hypothetical protein ACT4OU_00295 [Hyphomicrobium sp.]